MHSRTALAGVLALTAALPAPAEDFTATIAAGHPPAFRWVRMIPEAFAPEVRARMRAAGHSIRFDEQFGGSIAGVGEELEAVEAGLAELGTCQAVFDQSKLAVQNVTYYTPFVSDDTALVSAVIDELHATLEPMSAAYGENGVVYVGAPITLDDYMLLTSFEVDSLADLDGRKIAAPGAAINWLSGTGAVGVAGDLTTYYNEIKTGVYDGVLAFASAALPARLHEVAPFITRVGLGAQYAGSLCANADWWRGLPGEARRAIRDGADAGGRWYQDELERAVADALGRMSAEGATVRDAPEAMRLAWAGAMDDVARTWAAELEDRGARVVLEAYMERMRAAGARPLRDWDEDRGAR